MVVVMTPLVSVKQCRSDRSGGMSAGEDEDEALAIFFSYHDRGKGIVV